jgi:hypothetical protein
MNKREAFLLYMLGGIFAFQAAVFTFEVVTCARLGGLKACPEVGNHYTNTFNVMIATTLALLTAGKKGV